MGWLHDMTWIDIILMAVFVIAFWVMVLALATSLFPGHRYQRMAQVPGNRAIYPGSVESQALPMTPRYSQHDER